MKARRLFSSSLEFVERTEQVLGDRTKAERLHEILYTQFKPLRDEEGLSRCQLDQIAMQYMAEVDQHRTEKINAHNLQFQTSKVQIEKAFRDMRLSKLKVTDGMQNARSEAILEFYLERLKQKEMFESIDLRIQQTRSKADQEASNCQEKMSQARSDIFMHSIGSLIASAAGVLGFIRIFRS